MNSSENIDQLNKTNLFTLYAKHLKLYSAEEIKPNTDVLMLFFLLLPYLDLQSIRISVKWASPD